jgi:hypothetical protein
MGDVYVDTIGAGVGTIAATLAGSGLRWPLLKELSNDPPATMALLMWFGYRLYPYVPVTSAHKYIRAFAPIDLHPALSTIDLIRFTTAWACIGASSMCCMALAASWSCCRC